MENIFNNVSSEIKNGLTPNQSIDYRELCIVILKRIGGSMDISVQELMADYSTQYIKSEQDPMTLEVNFSVANIETEKE